MNRPGIDERLPLYQRLRDEIVARVAAGEWLPGSAIPTEAELSRQYEIAVGTVRKAVDMLVAEGLLLRSQGRGTFVRRPDFGASFFRFFRQVGPGGEPVMPTSRILSCVHTDASEAAAAALGLAPGAPALFLQRERIIAPDNLFREEIWLPASRFLSLLDVPLAEFDNLLYPFYESHCGQPVASARETLRVESASAEVAAELRVAEGRPVIVVERIAFGYDRAPLEYRLSRGVADHFHYQIEIS